MGRKTLMVSVVLGVFGIVIAVTGFFAQETRNKTTTLGYTGLAHISETSCDDYRTTSVTGYAITAVVALVLVRVIVAANTGGFSTCKVVLNMPKLARAFIYISWITSCISIVLFIMGVISNNKAAELQFSNGQYQCYFAKSAVFPIATITGILSVPLAIIYYLKYVSAVNAAVNTSGIIELEAPPVTDDRKPSITDGKKPLKPLRKP